MRRSNFALRLHPSLLGELRKAAELEGVALNQLINVAVAFSRLPGNPARSRSSTAASRRSS
jgi:hypothetical protein